MKRRPGRPLKYDKPLDASLNVKFRVHSDLKERLKRAAEANNRSLSDEVLSRLSISLEEKNILQEVEAVFARYK